MSFRCDFCKKVQSSRVSQTMLLVKWRKAEYPERRDSENHVFDPGGSGWEIEQEARACPDCAKANQPDN